MSEVERLRSLLSEGLDLCVRAKKLDDDANKAMIASRQTRCATPAMWVLQQYDRDLADWEEARSFRADRIGSNSVSVMVAMIDRPGAFVLTMDGQKLPITDWVDRDGVVDCPPDEAVFCVAGPDARGKWWTIDVRHLLSVTIQ